MLQTRLDAVHEKLRQLNDELHAQPPDALAAPWPVSGRVRMATCDGPPVAAVTCHGVGLHGNAAKNRGAAGLRIDKAVTMGISIPLAAGAAFPGVRRQRKSISQGESTL